MPLPNRARKAIGTPSDTATLQRQLHRRTQPSDSRTDLVPVARKSAHPDASQRVRQTVPDSTGARNTPNAPRPIVTSRPYAIAGVAGFHRAANSPVTRFSQLERRLKPTPRKNVNFSRITHYPKMPKDRIPSGRPLGSTATKSLSRRMKAATQVGPSRRRDLLLNQHRNHVDSVGYATIVFGRTSLDNHQKLAESSNAKGKRMPKPTTTGTPVRSHGSAVADEDDAVWKSMVVAFGSLSLSTVNAVKKRRLPFLRRVVRTSFLRRCQMKGLVVNSVSPEKQLLDILYKMPKDVSDDEWDNEVTEYAVHEVKLAFDQLVCPLCDTLGRLITKEMLEAHLEWDHPEVETNWRRRKNGSLELTLELPGDEILVDEWEGPESSRSSTLDPLDRHWPPVDAPPVSEPGPRESPTPTQQAATYVEHPVTAFFQLKPEFSPTPASRTASLIPDEASDSLHQAPGSRDPLGPLAVYPYHPVSVDDDNDTLGFSCRPCGPRLYDLVARYPMSDYGLTSWSLLERDEELFEIDDIRDEEKAMQALWNRWIFFKRRSYLLDHCKSVIEFVKTFHTTIMETAGWKGMRVWLLLLAKHKYLTGDDVVTIMAQYETIAAIEP